MIPVLVLMLITIKEHTNHNH